MRRICKNSWCGQAFDISSDDQDFLKKFDAPDPECCPQCRHQHRALFKGEMRLHRRESDFSKKPVISIYPQNTPFPVYAIDEWWSDHYDPAAYGREYDFSRPFFGQFHNLFRATPKMAHSNEQCENSEYSTYAGKTKNAYYCHEVYRGEDLYYCRKVTGYNQNLCDCLRCQGSSYLYECVQCNKCHSSSFLYRCQNSRDCHFCIDCQGCADCLFSWNLRNKQYHILNKPVSKAEFERTKVECIDGRFSTQLQNRNRLRELYPNVIWKNLNTVNCEDCVGDALTNCAHCHECYNCVNCEGNRYCIDMSPSEKNRSSMDQTGGGIGELLYNNQGLGGGNYFVRMSVLCRGTSDMTYCINAYHSKNCFGCADIKNCEYFILNKPYSKEQYETIIPKIIGHMRQTGEWGRFFPTEISPFSYNTSLAGAFFPLTKNEVLQRGWQWDDDDDLQPEGTAYGDELPDSIDDVDDAICKQVLTCRESRRKYKIQQPELAFYKLLRCPIPRVHPLLRMQQRLSMLNPYQLWNRTCAKCQKPIATSYAPERPEIVYCDSCYLLTVY